ncbi:hypothetical protein CEXT_513141, partial [Caerostris extrusa]
IAVILSQVVCLVCINLVFRWCQMFGGFTWDSDADKQFYYHPLLMILGLVFFYGDVLIPNAMMCIDNDVPCHIISVNIHNHRVYHNRYLP